MVLVMRNTLVSDRRSGGQTALGVLTGNAFHISYCALGLGLLLSRSESAYTVLRYASALYLVYLAVQGLRSRGHTLADTKFSSVAVRRRHPYLEGLINNLLNPKGGLFYLGVFSQVITPDLSTSDTLLLIATMVSVSALFWVGFVQTLHLPSIRGALRRWSQAVDRTFAIVLLGLAARVVFIE